MTVAAVLLGYAVGAGTAGSRLLGRARWTARAPLLAIATYLAAQARRRSHRARSAVITAERATVSAP